MSHNVFSRKFILFCFLTATVAAVSATAQSVEEIELPSAPAGFEWQRLSAVKAAFLMPNGWHFFSQDLEGTNAYFITEQDIPTEGVFSTGLSLNVIRDVPGKTDMAAEDYAKAHTAAATTAETTDEVLEEWDNVQGVFHSFGVRYRSTRPDGGSVIINQVNVGNSETGTLYLLIFEAPAEQWEAAWAKGQRMMSQFIIDQGV